MSGSSAGGAPSPHDGRLSVPRPAPSQGLAHLVLFTPDVSSVVHSCLTIEALLALTLTCRAAKAAIAFATFAEAVLAARGAENLLLGASGAYRLDVIRWLLTQDASYGESATFTRLRVRLQLVYPCTHAAHAGRLDVL